MSHKRKLSISTFPKLQARSKSKTSGQIKAKLIFAWKYRTSEFCNQSAKNNKFKFVTKKGDKIPEIYSIHKIRQKKEMLHRVH